MLSRRFCSVLVAFLSAALISLGLSSVATASTDGATASKAKKKKKKAKKPRNVKPRLAVLNVNSAQLAKGNLRVRVAAPRRSKVRVSSISTTFDAGKRQLTKARVIRIGRSGKRTVALKLTPAARRAVAGCEARRIVVTAKRGKRQTKVVKSMNRTGADCRLAPVDLTRAADCDFIAQPKEGMCMLPFPTDFYTRDDSTSPTGKRINFTAGGMPQNNNKVPINPDDYNLSDGFSQGVGIALKIPGIETAEAVTANKLVPINYIGRYNDPDQRVMVIDAETGERWPIWANIDSNAKHPKDALLEIKPAQNFEAGKRYIVALRNLTDANGTKLDAPNAFRYYRDQLPSKQQPVNQRRAHYEGIFKSLKKAKVTRSSLYLAWDFTVASDENNYKRVLSMRDRAFKELGDENLADQKIAGRSPEFEIDTVTDYTVGQNARIARYVTGSFTVPCFLEPDCEPGGTMNLDKDGLPSRNGNYTADLACIIPRVALDGAPQKMRPMVYGHGLFGKAEGVVGSINPQLAQDHGMLLCATSEIGMSGYDVGKVGEALLDLSKFKVLPDRLAQGILNELFLARMMFHPQGLGTDPAFQNSGQSVIDTNDVFYMGASQGGIMGGALTAVSPDFIQSSLLVGAMNYSTLLPRSVDFDIYAGIMYPAYPDEMARPLLFSIMQMLWDRSEPNGYAHRMTDNPPPNTPKHNITMQIALGDHEVTNFAAEVWARTVGAATNDPAIDPARWPNYDIMWNVPRIKPSEYPYRGSNLIYFDGGPERLSNPADPNSSVIGTPPPPFENIPNRAGQNPHGAPGGATAAVEMTASFLQRNGYIEDICAPKSCYSDIWNGLPLP